MKWGSFAYSLALLVLSLAPMAALHATIVRIEIFVNDSADGMVPVNPITDDSAPGVSTQGIPAPSPPGTVPIEEYVNAPLQQQQPQYNIVPIESLFWDAGSLSLSSRVQDFKYEIIYAGSIADVKLFGVPISRIEVGGWQAGAGIAVDSFQYAGFSQAYAIETLGVDSATATITAVGDSLYKCANWEFISRTCNGEWEFQKTITPGQEYSIAISPGDPAYGENMSGHPAAPSPSPPPMGPNTLAMVNSRGELYETNITVSDSSGKGISGGRKQMGVGSMPASSYMVGFSRDTSAATRANPSPLLPPVEDIVFEDLSLPSGGNAILRVDAIDPYATPFGMHAKKAYAIDPSSLNFTHGTVKVMARGTELYKCAGWIFDSGTCAGGWEKVMDIIPGQYYYINITPDDPGYVEYSPYLGAPVCLTTDSPCIAGSDLLQSRDNLDNGAGNNAEPNQPNTIDTCTDGTTGTYGSDESAENITINDTSSSYFRGGDTVNVTAWVHPYSGGTDYADIFYSNTTYPLAWKLKYTSGGLSGTFQSVSTTFALDNVAGQHAVRVQFRYGGANTSNCTTAAYDDHDDVAFQVVTAGTTLSSCQQISSAGSYRLSSNIQGNVSAGRCIYISTSNVALDCAGYTMTGNTSGTTYGVYTASSLQNITVTNCIIRNYTYGFYMGTPTYANLFNNTVYNVSYGYFVSGGQYNTLTGNTAFNITSNGYRLVNARNYTVRGNAAYNIIAYGFYILWPYSGNSFTDNQAYNNAYGFYVDSNSGAYRLAYSIFQNNTAYSITNDGFYIDYAENSTFANNTAYLNKHYGFYFFRSCLNDVVSGNFAYNNSQREFSLTATGAARTNNMTFSNNRAWNDTQHGFYMDYVENSTFTNNTAYLNNYYGFYIADSQWNLFQNNNASNDSVFSTSYAGFYTTASDYNNFTNNTMSGNKGMGIYLYSGADYNILENNTAWDNGVYSFDVFNSVYNNFTGNVVNNTNRISATGFYTSGCTGCRIVNNYARNCAASGFSDSSTGTVLINNTIINSGGSGSGVVVSSSGCTIVNNTATNTSIGAAFSLSGVSNCNITGNLANITQTGANCFVLSGSSAGVNFTSNTAYGCDGSCFYVSSSSVAVNNITGTVCTNYGLQLLANYVIINNANLSAANSGFYTTSAQYNNVTNVLSYGNTYGFYLSGVNVHNNTFINATAYGNSNTGIYLPSSAVDNSFINSSTYSNTQYGIYVYQGANINATNTHSYNNSAADFYFSPWGSTITPKVYFNNLTIDNPYGDFTNYTSISLIQSISGGFTIYSIGWTSNSTAIPAGVTRSFNQKYINITAVSGDPLIDQINFTWVDSELGDYNETKLQIWKYNTTSNWTFQNGTPDTTNNVLSLSSFSPSSTYGIFESITTYVSGCQAIFSSGNYALTSDVQGNISYGGYSFCLGIAASNVTLDCAGYTVTGNDAGTVYGIFVKTAGIQNITITNCRVNNYTYGIGLDGVSYERLYNNFAFNNTGYGFYINSSPSNNLTNNTASGNSVYGFNFESSPYNVLTNNTAERNIQDGFRFYLSDGANITGANASFNSVGSSSYNGMTFASSSNCIINRSVFYSNGKYGFSEAYSNNTGIYDTRFFNNSNQDLYMLGAFPSAMVSISNATFDNPQGTFENYTTITINDIIGDHTAQYAIKWSGLPSPIPGGRLSFAQKFINITTISGTVSIDSIIWSWLDSELGAEYNETKFELWKYSSGWSLLNSTPDTAAHTFGLTNMNPASTYGILQNNYTGCVNLSDSSTWQGKIANSSGVLYVNKNTTLCTDTYYLNASASAAALQMNASNIYLDCNGSTLDGVDGNGWGIYSQLMENNTIMNCLLTAYNNGIYLEYSNGSTVSNSTGYNNTQTCFYLLATSGSMIANNTAYNNTYGIYADMVDYSNFVGNDFSEAINGMQLGATYRSNYNNLTNNIAYNSSVGYYLYNSSNNTLVNNTARNNTNGGFILEINVDNNTFINNTAYGNTQGFYLLMNSNINYFLTNTAYDNLYGFLIITSSNNNTFTGNAAYNNTDAGFQIQTSSGNNLTNNTAHDSIDGFALFYSNYTNLDGNVAYNSTYGFYLNYVNGSTVSNSTSYGNTGSGVYMLGSSGNVLTGITSRNNSQYGFFLGTNANYNNLSNNSAYNNTNYGIYLSAANSNNFNGDFSYNNSNNGIYIQGSYNTFTNDRSWSNYNTGFVVVGNSNNFTNISSIGNSMNGFYLASSNSNILTNCTGSGGTNNGAYITNSDNNIIDNSTFSGANTGVNFVTGSDNNIVKNSLIYSTYYGVRVLDASGNNITSTRFYGMTTDAIYVVLSAVSMNLYLSNATFDNPSGTMENYTVLDLTDSIAIGESYAIRYAQNNTALSDGRLSFAQKFINISTPNSTVSIDSIVWSWQASETTGHSEARLELWKYNTTWTLLNSTPDTAAHTLGLTNMNPASTYGILENTAGCVNLSDSSTWYGKIVNSSGVLYVNLNTTICTDTYYLNNATSTAQVIQFNSSSIYLNCNGSTIDGVDKNGYGIYSTKSNVVMANCTIRNYYYGIFQSGGASNSILSTTVGNNSGGGMILSGTSYNKVKDSYAYNNTVYGYLTQVSSTGNNFTNDTSSGDGYGFYVYQSAGNRYTNISASNSQTVAMLITVNSNGNIVERSTFNKGSYGVYLSNSSYNSVINNSILNMAYCGYLDANASNNVIENNTMGNSTQQGIYILQSFYNNITGNMIYNSTIYGVYLSASNSNNLTNNIAYSNFQSGFISDASNNNTFTNNSAYNNSGNGFYVYINSNNNSLISNTAYRNSAQGFLVYTSSGNTLINNTAFNNTQYGFYLQSSSNYNTLSSNTAYENTYGLRLDGSSYINITNNSLYNNSIIGIFIYSNSHNNTINGNRAFNNTQQGIYVSSSSHQNNITNNVAYLNKQYGIVVATTSYYNTFINNSAYNNTQSGFLLNVDASRNRFFNNSAFFNVQNGFYLSASYNNTLEGNIAYNNSQNGFLIYTGCVDNNFTGNLAENNSQYGFYTYTSNHSILVNNNASYNLASGFLIYTNSNSNILTNNTAFKNSNVGFYLYSNLYNILTNNTAINNTNYGFYDAFGNFSIFTNNTAFGSTYCFLPTTVSFNTFTGNLARNCVEGFQIASSSNNTFTNNTAYRNSDVGFYLPSSSSNNLTNNSAYYNSYGLYISSANYNNLIGNNFSSNIQGFDLITSSYNNLTGNLASNNTQRGFYLQSSSNYNTLANNTAYNNTIYGIDLVSSTGNNLTGNNASYNIQNGINLDAASGSNNLAYNYACFNTLIDINNLSSGNTGLGDRCDDWFSWSESGHVGCAKTCSEIWHTFYGNASGSIVLAKSSTTWAYSWAWGGTGNVYAANADETIHWGQLQALGRNTTGGNSTDDFEELDSLLGYSAITADNINYTFSSDGSNPKETASFRVYMLPIANVSIANSTNSTARRTGILWDTYNVTGEFNITNNPAVVFMTNITQNAPGKYAGYTDYEIRVPGTLDTYKGTSGLVYFYLELD